MKLNTRRDLRIFKMLTKLYDPAKGPMKLAIFMSGSGSNAVKILERYAEQVAVGSVTYEPVVLFSDNHESNVVKIATQFGVPYKINPIRDFYNRAGADIKDMDIREDYDTEQVRMLKDLGVDAVALAGYDWKTTPLICNEFVTGNVHPGDLRVKKADGKRKYIGLGWVPSAKAILDRKNEVYTSVHLVTPELDEGPLLAVSAPQSVPEEVLGLERKVLLGEAESIGGILRFIKENTGVNNDELARIFPIYGYARECQERLKVHGDWIEFPDAIVNISSGIYERDGEGKLYFEGNPIPEGVLRRAA